MRKLLALMMLAGLLLSAAPVYAQDSGSSSGGSNGKVRSKFYNFNDMLIDGQFKSPDVLKAQAHEKAKFKRLLKLKKSFLPKVIQTTQDTALD